MYESVCLFLNQATYLSLKRPISFRIKLKLPLSKIGRELEAGIYQPETGQRLEEGLLWGTRCIGLRMVWAR